MAPKASAWPRRQTSPGEYPVAIYKELLDFKTGARASAVMAPLVADLSDEDMRDLAAYYAYLPRVYGDQATEGENSTGSSPTALLCGT